MLFYVATRIGYALTLMVGVSGIAWGLAQLSLNYTSEPVGDCGTFLPFEEYNSGWE